MSFYVAYPSELVDELLGNLPSDMRPKYAEHFKPVVGDLIWLIDDAENALQVTLQQHPHPLARTWLQNPDMMKELAQALLERENEDLVRTVQTELESMAAAFIDEQIRLQEA